MLRVGLIVPSYSLDERGTIPTINTLVRCLSSRVDLYVLALRYPPEPARYRVEGAQIEAVGGARETRQVLLAAIRALRRRHRRSPFDVLHARGVFEAGLVGVLTGRLLRVPTLITIGGGEIVGLPDIGYGALLTRRGRLLTRGVFRGASLVAGGSSYSLALARAAVPGRAPDRFRFAPHPVDTTRFRPPDQRPPYEPDRPRLLSAAALIPVKDHPTLLQAFARIQAAIPGATLTLAGEDPLGAWPRLERMAADLGVADRIRYCGRRLQDEMVALYHRADLLLMTSRYENEPLVVGEAAACGVPTVGTDVGVVHDLAPDAALAVPVADPGALADAALSLLRDDRWRRSIAAGAFERVMSVYGHEPATRRYLALYEELAREA